MNLLHTALVICLLFLISPGLATSEPLPPVCFKPNVEYLSNACQCHFTLTIGAITVFKKISVEGQIQSCLQSYGPRNQWRSACHILLFPEPLVDSTAIDLLTTISTKCTNVNLCRFFVNEH